jgi:dTMP kinase
MKNYRNFISFEGIDFCGKTTQIQFLREKLRSRGIEVLIFREPGGTVISEKIRSILLNSDHDELHKITEILLYEAARAQLVHEKLIPQLEKGIHVIADRFFDSTTTYQGYGREIDINIIQRLNAFATSDLKPFKTFFLDIPPEEAENRHKRENRQKDRLEKSGLHFYSLIRNGFIELSEQEPARFLRIDGLKKPEEISDIIWKNVTEFWPVSHKTR